MTFTDKITSIMPNVYFLYQGARFIKRKNNSEIKKISDEFKKIDSISNFSGFVDKVQSLIASDNVIRAVYPNSENTMYGHLLNFYEYAGLEFQETPFICVEHGVNFLMDDMPRFKYEVSTVMLFQSNYKREMIHRTDPLKPVFAVGPYVHYAKPYYDDEKLHKIKSKSGKTIVIYLGHTWEKTSVERDIYEYIKIIRRFQKEYDSIVFCLYWTDCRHELIDTLSKEDKVHFVSAGYRGDPLFLSRTRTIIEMADTIAGNDIGTYIGYALYLNKPIVYLDTADRVTSTVYSPNLQIGEENKRRIVNAMKNDYQQLSEDLYNEFWGGDCIKTPEDMRSILLLADQIAKEAHGFKKRFSSVTRRIITDSHDLIFEESIENSIGG